ncbi:MAG: SRPBCC domain-containing protein [Actinomycetota bacterium]
MTTATDVPTAVATQVYRVYIKAPRERVWQAITDPEWTVRYGYGGRAEYDPGLRPGARYRGMLTDAMKERGGREGHPTPDVGVDGEILEVDPPERLVQTFRMVMEPTMAAEGFTRVTYELEEREGATKLTVVHELEGAPTLAAVMSGGAEDIGGGGGWSWVLSDLKSLLETGERMADV